MWLGHDMLEEKQRKEGKWEAGKETWRRGKKEKKKDGINERGKKRRDEMRRGGDSERRRGKERITERIRE